VTSPLKHGNLVLGWIAAAEAFSHRLSHPATVSEHRARLWGCQGRPEMSGHISFVAFGRAPIVAFGTV
jgi:hypothetical protein